MVTWNYGGSTSISMTTDTITGHSYLFKVTDGSTNHIDSFTGTGSPMTRTVSGLSGLSAGDPFSGFLQDDTGDEYLAANNFIFGTASVVGGGIAGVWSYNGTTGLTLTFTGTAGVSYYLQGDYYFGGSATEDQGSDFTGTGSSQTVSLTLSHTPVLGFAASLWLDQDTFTSPASRMFTGSSAGAGSPGNPSGIGSFPAGRVLIAWDDGPLVASPTWTAIDQGGSTFPYDFVAGYDTHVGRQTLIAQTETGTATVYVNDRSGLFDDRNGSSPFQGKLSGRQIVLQIYNPVEAAWEPQFRGLIDDYSYVIDGSAVGPDGAPINASIQLSCVDMFDYLTGYLLTPGLDGVTPPAGSEDTIYYAATSGTVDDRLIAILTNANIDPAMYGSPGLASGNVKVVATQYNVDESALTAIRDAADAELPFIANCYVDRRGRFQFRGRYGRFDPDGVSGEPGSTWDFTRWKVGDGAAIHSDPTRAQIRVLEYSRDRQDLINSVICYPQGLPATGMASQVYADSSSITAYGKHQAQPISDLITGAYSGPGTITPDTGIAQCQLYAELLVKNKKDPRICPTSVQLKSIQTTDFRASATWNVLTKSDISHIVNIAVGYPGGTGLTGGATADDYYIEGRSLTVRPANSAYDMVTLDLEVTPYVWSADTHGVFPAFGT